MGSRGDSGAGGSDAGFENNQKSKLSKKNKNPKVCKVLI